jgi:hypothetical protein
LGPVLFFGGVPISTGFNDSHGKTSFRKYFGGHSSACSGSYDNDIIRLTGRFDLKTHVLQNF